MPVPTGRGFPPPVSQVVDRFSHVVTIQMAAAELSFCQSTDPSVPLRPLRIVDEVRRVMPEDGVLALDNGMYKIWFTRDYPAFRPNSLLVDNALATMGAGLPSPIAARLVHPDRPVVAVCGDGGFLMNSQELETALRLGLDLVVLVLRDDAYGMIRWKQMEMGLSDFGLRFGNPGFVRYAESYGARGYRVGKPGELASHLRDAVARRGVDLIEVPVDYGGDHHLLAETIPARVRTLRAELRTK